MSGDYREFLRARAPEAFRAGPILDERGREVGEHGGLGGYTVGQRRGPRAARARGGLRRGAGPARNAVVVGPREALRATRLVAEQVNLIALATLEAPLDVEARVRHRAPRVPARVVPRGATGASRSRSKRPSTRSRPGQSVVSTAARWSSGAA